jgi:hypothetical protein
VPFDAPRKGKIAVNLINHYGDEVPRVYDVQAMKWSRVDEWIRDLQDSRYRRLHPPSCKRLSVF